MKGSPKKPAACLMKPRRCKKQIELMSEERGLELPALGEERKFVPEFERKSDEEPEQRDILTATKEYRDAWFKVLTGRSHDLGEEERSMMQRVLKENRSLSSGSDKDGDTQYQTIFQKRF